MSYHLTEEQAVKLWKSIPVSRNAAGSPDFNVEITNFANAVLDKVLGEHVGVISLVNDGSPVANFDITDLPIKTKLYAPKELP